MYQKTTLSNGIRVITERVPYLSSVSVGIWINTGSRYEDLDKNGICHFIEHILFKGTKRRDAFQIAKEIDSVGGVLNAFTSREYTCLYAKVLDRHLPLALDLLSDIFLYSLFDFQEIEKEREVIFQEISMMEDNPEEYVHELLWQSVWRESSLGLSPLGTVKTVKGLSQERLVDYYRKNYLSHRVIISAAGNLDHNNLLKLIEGAFGNLPGGKGEVYNHLPELQPEISIKNKNLEQVHLCLGAGAPCATSPQRYEGFILNTLLGGNMSSRLFQEIREKRGLAYSIYSFQSSFVDTGLLEVYAGVREDTLSDVLALIFKELKRFKEELIEEKELKRAKEYLKGNLILNLENVDNRMNRLAKNEIYFQKKIPIEEVISGIDNVSALKIAELATEIFEKDKLALSILGKVDKEKINRDIFEI